MCNTESMIESEASRSIESGSQLLSNLDLNLSLDVVPSLDLSLSLHVVLCLDLSLDLCLNVV